MPPKPPNHALSEMKCPVTLEDVDLFGPGAQEHWYEAYRILHDEAPVQVLPGEGLFPGTDGFVLTKYADIMSVVKDPERFTPTLSLAVNARPREGAEAPQMNDMIVSMRTLRPDAALWRAHRRELTDPWVGPGAERHSEMITSAADALIDGWIGDGEVEFVSRFARPLPQIVLATVLGFPLTDLPRLERWGSAQVAPFVHGKGHRNLLSAEQIREQSALLEGFRAYVCDQVQEKRRNPQDDMISFLTDVTYEALGRKLTDDEINGVVYAMVIGGLETTQYALEEQAQLLCENPALFDLLRRDRTQIRPFIEEGMRLRAPTQGLSTRITTRDEEFQGVPVPRGSLLHLRFAAGNVDAEQYECPHEVKLDRKPVRSHLAFSQGPRVCPGAGISRLEQTIAWERLLERIDGLAYAPGNRFLHQPGIMLGTLELNLAVTPAR